MPILLPALAGASVGSPLVAVGLAGAGLTGVGVCGVPVCATESEVPPMMAANERAAMVLIFMVSPG